MKAKDIYAEIVRRDALPVEWINATSLAEEVARSFL